MRACVRRLRPFLALASVVGVAAVTVPAAARPEPLVQPFAQAEIFLELNDTDGDLGIHAAIDGGIWTSLSVEGPDDLSLLGIVSRGRLRRQGLTQLAFESAEPSFDELSPEQFFRRFPEGMYDVEAVAQDGGIFESEVRLSHVLAAPVEATVSGVPSAENCDAVLPLVTSPVVIDWDPVTTSHPTIGKRGRVSISRYQLFVEKDATKLSLDLPPDVTEFTVPDSVTSGGGVFKFEIIARTSRGNNTAVESCFEVR